MKDSGSVGSKRIIYTVLLVSVLILALAAIAISGAVLIRNGKITPPDTAFAQSSGDKDEKGNGDKTVTITDNMIDVNAAGPSVAARIAAGDKAIKLSDGAETGMLTAATGTCSDTYSVINFTNKGAAAELHADISEPVPESASEPVVIAIREIHRENGEVLAYRVYVDGSAVYFRTYGQIASAPNVLYVLVPRSEIYDLKNVGIKIVSESRAVFSVADVTVYTRLFETEAEENPDDRLGIYLHSADSVDKAKAHISDFSGYSYGLYRLGLLFKIDYMNKTPDEIASYVASALSIAGNAGWDVQLMPTVYWGQPNLPDGQGGMMTDAKYQQIAYSSVDGRYYGTFPNVYSSTVWITSASSVLNGSFTKKINDVFGRISGILGQARASGTFTGRAAVVMEHGVCYKGPESSTGTAFNSLDCGDVGPLMKELAKLDGVTLDPTDGLSREEKLWMIKHHADYNQTLADAYNLSLGSDAVTVTDSGVMYPTYQTADNILTHGVQWIERSPSYGDELVTGWKSGVGTGMYSSSEDMWWDDVRFYQYKAAYGRIGTVNFEVSYSHSADLAGDRNLLRKAYELGFEYLTLFNDSSSYETAKLIGSLDSIGSEKATFTVRSYDVPLLDASFPRDAAVPDWESRYGLISSDNVTFDVKNGVLRLSDGSSSGSVTFRITSDETFPRGLRLHVESLAGNGTVSVTAGQISLGKAGRGSGTNYVNGFVSDDYDITGVTYGVSAFDVTVTLTGSSGVRAVGVYEPFGTGSGQLNGVSLTRSQARVLALNTEREALADNMLARYFAKAGKDGAYSEAESLIDEGKYITAYRYLSQRLSAALPASFTVSGSGYFGTLGVYAEAGGNTPVGVTVLSLGKNDASFSFFTNYSGPTVSEKSVSLTVSGLADGKYSLTEDSFNVYSLKKSAEGDVTAEGGKASFTVIIKYGSASSYVKHTEISGRCISSGNYTVTLMTQDLSVTGYSPRAEFAYANSCVFTRHAYGSDESTSQRPQSGDYVTLRFGSNGTTVVSVESVYGRTTGVVTEYIRPDYSDPDTPNGLIRLEGGEIYEIEYLSFTTVIVADAANRYARTFTDEELGRLLVGKTVSIEYCPELYGEYMRALKITVR